MKVGNQYIKNKEKKEEKGRKKRVNIPGSCLKSSPGIINVWVQVESTGHEHEMSRAQSLVTSA
ncbi:hypothetical protein J6590_095357 [Homalodisca vitripennis]|nr:hypothetical protein J6590_095357 [Homalodisca vitripennis]